MKRVAFVAAAAALVAVSGAVAYKAWRYRKDAQLWHGRWLALHGDPGGRDQYRADNERLRAQGVAPHRVVFLGASITEMLDLAGSFPDRNFVNRGAGGQPADRCKQRFRQQVESGRPPSITP